MASASDLLSLLPGYFTIAEARDLPEDNSFTIKTAGKMAVGRDKEEKPVLTFEGTAKGLVLNKARVNQLQALFGKNELVGQTIRLAVNAIDGKEQITINSAG